MLPRLLIVGGLLLGFAPAAAVAAPCPVPTLPEDTLASGDEAVERYRELRRLQFDPGLMGYLDRCARRVTGGLHLDQDAPGGIRVVASVVAGRARHLEALSSRYRLRALLRVRRVRFTERRLRSVYERVTGDFDEIEALYSATLSIRHNRVLVGLRGGSARDRRLLRRRHGPALRFWAAR